MHDVAKGISSVPVQSGTRPRRRRRPVVIAIGLLVAILVFAFGIKALQIGKMMSTRMLMPPTTVSSATVKEEDWAPTLSAVGSISAGQGGAGWFPASSAESSAKSRSKTAVPRRKAICWFNSTRRPKRRFCDRQKLKPSWDGRIWNEVAALRLKRLFQRL